MEVHIVEDRLRTHLEAVPDERLQPVDRACEPQPFLAREVRDRVLPHAVDRDQTAALAAVEHRQRESPAELAQAFATPGGEAFRHEARQRGTAHVRMRLTLQPDGPGNHGDEPLVAVTPHRSPVRRERRTRRADGLGRIPIVAERGELPLHLAR